MRLIFLLFTLLYFNADAEAQTISSENVLGTNYIIKSEILKEARQIQVFMPESYDETDKKYPVLYILDGQRLFPYGVGLLKSFTQFQQTPEFIIVGITNKYPDRFGHFTDSENKFLSFLEQEVIPFVDNSFRASNERLIFGWEYGGSFVIQSMMDSPDLFNAYLTASPFPLQGKITELDNFFSKRESFDKTLYFTVSPNEDQVNVGTGKLDSILKLKAPDSLNWTYKILENEEHLSTPYSTIYFGLQNYYRYYPELQFNNLDEFKNIGGLNYVYDYYEKRASRFGFSGNLSDWTMFSLTRNAIRADDYHQFNILVKEFENTGFLQRIRISRSCMVANYYLENKEYDKSIQIFTLLAESHPNSERPLEGLGDAYKALKKERKASLYYEKAKQLAQNKSNQ